jgi:hypothetical protein
MNMEGFKLEAQERVFCILVLNEQYETHLGLPVNYPMLLSEFKIWSFLTDFRKSLQYQISRKSRLWEPSWYRRANRQRAGQTVMTKVIVANVTNKGGGTRVIIYHCVERFKREFNSHNLGLNCWRNRICRREWLMITDCICYKETLRKSLCWIHVCDMRLSG